MKKLLTLLTLAFYLTGNAQCSINITGNPSFCAGGSTTFTLTGATSYTWAPATSLSNANGAIITASPVSNTIYTVTSTTGTCVATNTVAVTVIALPIAPVLSAPTGINNTYCAGNPISLTVNSGTNVAVWYSNNTVVNGGSSFTPPSNLPAGTYTYSIIDSIPIITGCVNAPQSANTLTLSVTVNPIPSAPTLTNSIANPLIICQGINYNVTVVPASGSSVVWYSGNAFLSSGNTYTPSTANAGTKVYSIKDSAVTTGCTSVPLLFTVTVNPTPTVTINSPITGCVPLCNSFTTSINPPANTYLWDFGNGQYSTQASPASCYTVAGTSIVSLTITTANGCTNIATGMVTANPVPTITVSPQATSYCAGANIPAPAINLAPIAATLSWTNSNSTIGLAVSGTGIPSTFIAPNVTSTDVAVISYTPVLSGCIGTVATQTITVYPLPIAPVLSGSTGTNNVYCSGNPLPLTVNSGTNIAVWYNGNVLVNKGTSYTPPLNLSPGTYVFSIIDSTAALSGCVNALPLANTLTVSVTVNPSPAASFTLTQDPTPHVWDAYASFTGGVAPYVCTWNWGDGTSSNTPYPSHTYSVAGTYSICVMMQDANGCISTDCQNDAVFRSGVTGTNSSVVQINVLSSAAGIKQTTVNNEVSIYPNPNNGNFIIETNTITASKQTLQVYDITGKIVLSQTLPGKTTIDASGLPDGIYNISIIGNETLVNKRIVIAR